jgi:hypothetical protein
MIFPAFAAAVAGASRRVSRAGRAAARDFVERDADLRGPSAFVERPEKWDFLSGTRVFGAPEILECYVTVGGPPPRGYSSSHRALRKRREDRAKSQQKS